MNLATASARNGSAVHPRQGDVRPDLAPPVLLVPGLGDSGPLHWQTLWGEQHRSFRRVVQPDWSTPKLNVWAAAVARAMDACRSAPIVVAHGFGCLAAVRAGYLFERPIAGALLVAPADPDRSGAGMKLPARPLPYPSVLVASSNDPWLKLLTAGALATRWGSRFVPLQGVGHLDDASSVGRWPNGLLLLGELRDQVTSGRSTRKRA